MRASLELTDAHLKKSFRILGVFVVCLLSEIEFREYFDLYEENLTLTSSGLLSIFHGLRIINSFIIDIFVGRRAVD